MSRITGFLILLLSVGGEAAVGQKIYWLEPEKVRRANLDGTYIETIAVLPYYTGFLFDLALDIDRQKIYWASVHRLWSSQRVDEIVRWNLDFATSDDAISNLLNCTSIAVDRGARKIYWSEWDMSPVPKGKVRRACLDGSKVEDVVAETALCSVAGIALDAVGGKVYWTEVDWPFSGTIGWIRRANLDGSHVETIITTGLVRPRGLAVDGLRRKVYWSDGETGGIHRADLDGSGVEEVIPGSAVPRACCIVLDSPGGKMYWIGWEPEYQGWNIQRANMDGTGIEDLIHGEGNIMGLDLDLMIDRCGRMDSDGDGDIDLCDFARFQRCFGREPF